MRIEDVTWSAAEPGPFSGGIIYEPIRGMYRAIFGAADSAKETP